MRGGCCGWVVGKWLFDKWEMGKFERVDKKL